MIQQTFAVQRAEERIDMKVSALLVGNHDKLGVETGVTADVSSRGARVITRSARPAGDTLLVAIPGFHFTAAARVAYCHPLSDGQFGIGLEFVVGSEPLEMTALATQLQFSNGSSPVASPDADPVFFTTRFRG
jgi:PilZ domain